MTQDEIRYFQRRAAEARQAAKASDGIVRQTHEEFASAYANVVARAVARNAVDELLG